MKRAILLTLAAGVATLPALWGVTGNTTFGQSVPAAIPSGASVAPSADDSRTSTPTASGTVDDRGGKGADDSATTSSGTTSVASSDDRRGRSSDDATSSSRTTSSKATVDDKGGSTGSGGDSGGHGGKGGSGKG
jgi:hypothetical protein